jgi:hypothetical protein
MKKALFLALFLCTLSAYAQKKEAKPAKENYNYWEVKIPMLNLIDPFSPNIQAGIEHRFDKHNSVSLTGGVSFDLDYDHNCCSDLNGVRVKADYIRYFMVRKKCSFFTGAELFYNGYNNNVKGTFWDSLITGTYTDYYKIHKVMYGLNLKIGFHCRFHKHLTFDFYTGLGLKHRTVTETDRDHPTDKMERAVDFSLWRASERTGDNTTLSLPLNLSIGYIFR